MVSNTTIKPLISDEASSGLGTLNPHIEDSSKPLFVFLKPDSLKDKIPLAKRLIATRLQSG